jgi:hypothetical protein
MATTKRGPTKGARVLVKLPFGRTVAASGKKPGKSQLVRVKQGVAKELGLVPLKAIPTVKVTGKSGTYTRIAATGSYRQESVTLIFDTAKSIKGSTGSYKTVSLPLGSGCTITDAVKYFEKSGKGVVALRTKNGVVIRWDYGKD